MRLLRQLRRDLAAFIEGHEHGILALGAARDHLPWMYMLLQELAETSPDVFLMFPHEFVDAEAYVALVAERVRASASEASGAPTLSLPEACTDPARPIADRLRATLAHARDLLPRGADAPRLVVVLGPLKAAGDPDYVALVRALVEEAVTIPPWFHRIRLIIHEPTGTTPPLRMGRFARALAVDLSTAAMERSIAEEAADPAATPQQRAHALLQEAAFHLGHRRLDDASRSYRALCDHAQETHNPLLTALALQGLGDVERARGRLEAALDWYERTLPPASEAGAPLVLLLVARALAHLYFELGRFSDAETFFDGTQQLAAALPEPETQAQALIWRGRAQERQGAPGRCAESLLAAARVARDNDRAALLDELRPRLTTFQRGEIPNELRREIHDFLARGETP